MKKTKSSSAKTSAFSPMRLLLVGTVLVLAILVAVVMTLRARARRLDLDNLKRQMKNDYILKGDCPVPSTTTCPACPDCPDSPPAKPCTPAKPCPPQKECPAGYFSKQQTLALGLGLGLGIPGFLLIIYLIVRLTRSRRDDPPTIKLISPRAGSIGEPEIPLYQQGAMQKASRVGKQAGLKQKSKMESQRLPSLGSPPPMLSSWV